MTAVAVSPSGGTIAVSWQAGATVDNGGLGLLDATDLSFTPVPWTIALPIVLRFADEGRLYASTTRPNLSGSIALVDVAAASVIPPTIELASAASELIPLDDGGALAALATGGLLRVRADVTAGAADRGPRQTPIAQLADGTILGVSSGRLIQVDPDERSAIAHEVRANGRRAVGLLAGSEKRLLLIGPDSSLVVVDSTTLAPVGPPLVTTIGLNFLAAVSMSPDGARIAVSGMTGVEVIDVAVGRAPQPPFPIGSVAEAAFAPDGRQLLIGGVDGKLHLIDAASGAGAMDARLRR